MGKYLKKFETQAAYEAAESNLILPNVSLISETNAVAYKPSVPPAPSHDYVEIGGIKWATMNVGASSITDTGLYFQWGDTSGYTASEVGSGDGKKCFGWADYKYWTSDDGSGSSGFTKYNSSDGKTVLGLDDDGVRANWGGNWRMPTTAEFQALGNAVNTAWTQVNGVSGMMCTDKTDETKTLFFPICGYANEGSMYYVGSRGYYWSSSRYSSSFVRGYHMNFISSTVYWGGSYFRRNGSPLRGVLDE